MLRCNLDTITHFRSKDSTLSRLLVPLGVAFDLLGGLRKGVHKRAYSPATPLICIGNILMGGGGKTPLVASLATTAAKMGLSPQLIGHCYGAKWEGKGSKAQKVSPSSHSAQRVGDEALELARLAPSATVWAGKPRSAVVRRADSVKGAKLLIMDDGMFDPSVAKTFTVLVTDEVYGFGNGRVFPAGPLRRSLKALKGRVDAVVVYGGSRGITQSITGINGTAGINGTTGIQSIADAQSIPQALEGIPHYTVQKAFVAQDLNKLKPVPTIAFCGISRPANFFDMLAEIVPLQETWGFASHRNPPARLMEQFATTKLQLVTTFKDFVRLPKEVQAKAIPLRLRLKWSKSPRGLIRSALAKAAADKGAF